MKNKASISRILIEQAIESLAYALDAKKKNQISKEIQNSINVSLMLGIAMEGIINEINCRTWQCRERIRKYPS